MLSINVINFLAMASAVAAIPSYRHHGHKHMHLHGSGAHPSGTASGLVPYPAGNSTGIWGSTGMAGPTGPTGASSYVPLSSTVAVSPVAPESSTTAYTGGDDSSTCTTDITVTSTTKVYVTVTLDGSSSSAAPVSETSSPAASTSTIQSTVVVTPSYSASASSSAEVSPVEPSSSSAAAPSASMTYAGEQKAHHRHSKSTTPAVYSTPSTSSSSEAAPVTPTSTYAAPTTTSSVYVAPTTPATSATSVKTTASSTSSSASPTKTSGSTGSGKRGLAYNDASLTTCFEGDNQISWAYNWGSSSSGLSSSFNYIPLLWGTSSDFTNSWSANAKAAIAAGSTHLMAFNEPDLSSQSNLSPQAAAEAYRTYMMPFANSNVKLGAPSVTNGGGAMGLTWLSNFMSECSDCQIDFVNIHWYDSYSNTAYFKSHVQNATDVAGGKPVFVSEFGTTDGSSDDISTFLEDVMPWMDSQSYVEGYAYFMASNGNLVSGDEPSAYGSVYATYTG